MPILTPTHELQRILVSRTDNLGDVICTLPIAVAIRRQMPHAHIAFMVKPYTASIVRRIAQIDQVLTLTELRRGLKLMKVYKPDAVIFAKPEFQLALEAVMARVDVRIGTGYRWYSGLFTRWVYDHRRRGEHHEAWYGVNMLGPLFGTGPDEVELPELPPLQPAVTEAETKLGQLGLQGDYMVVHPGSRGSANDYPPARYAAVIRELLAAYPDLAVIITAGPGEDDLAVDILDDLGSAPRVYVAGGLTLDGFSELLRKARLFLGGSSGPAHLAALVGTPVVGLYPGLPPMWPARWRPLGRQVITLVPHPEEPLEGGMPARTEPENVVARITPGRVLAACDALLQGKPVGHYEDYIS